MLPGINKVRSPSDCRKGFVRTSSFNSDDDGMKYTINSNNLRTTITYLTDSLHRHRNLGFRQIMKRGARTQRIYIPNAEEES